MHAEWVTRYNIDINIIAELVFSIFKYFMYLKTVQYLNRKNLYFKIYFKILTFDSFAESLSHTLSDRIIELIREVFYCVAFLEFFATIEQDRLFLEDIRSAW